MKILILGFAKIKYMPYMNFYLDNIDRKSNEIHLGYWNRDLKEENTTNLEGIKLHEFSFYQQDETAKIAKINSFLKYRKFALNLIKEISPDFIIVLHTLPGILIGKLLAKNYKNKYIFDYRDSTYEKFPPFQKKVKRLARNSKATFVSSDAFRLFLPQDKEEIYTSHNILEDSLSHRNEKEMSGVDSDKIRIAFWGFIRHEEINRSIIQKIAADTRFELHYYGREQQTALNLKKYAKEINAENVCFHGEYVPQDRYEFVKATDIIHNVYYDANMMLAMGNKYYDGIIFRIPQICMEGSFMGQQSEKCGVGFCCDPYKDDFTEKLYQWYTNIDREKFKRNCDRELSRVLKEYDFGREILGSL